MSATGNIRRSTYKDDWATPPDFMAVLAREFTFTLDVCASADNAVAGWWLEGPCTGGSGCRCGLCEDWRDNVCFMNPPYSQVATWVEKAIAAADAGATVVGLLPGAFGNAWYLRAIGTCAEERRCRERINFIHPPDCICRSCAEGKPPSGNATDSTVFIWRPGRKRWLWHVPRSGVWSWRGSAKIT